MRQLHLKITILSLLFICGNLQRINAVEPEHQLHLAEPNQKDQQEKQGGQVQIYNSDKNEKTNQKNAKNAGQQLQSSQQLNIRMDYLKNNVLQPISDNDIVIYSNNKLSSSFNKSLWNKQCCSSPDLERFQFNKTESPGIIVDNLDSSQDYNVLVSLSYSNNLVSTIRPTDPNLSISNPLPLPNRQKLTYFVQTYCKSDNFNADNYWSEISITFTFDPILPPKDIPQTAGNDINGNAQQNAQLQKQTINVNYFMACDPSFRPIKYAVSLNLLTIVLSILVFFMAIYSAPLSLNKLNQNRQRSSQSAESSYSQIISHRKFQRYEIKYYHSAIYAVLLITIGVTSIFIDNKTMEKIVNIIMAIITSASTWFFCNELLCYITPLKKKIHHIFFLTSFFKFQTMDIISIIFTALLEFLWLYFGKVWYVSDILAIFLLGSLMKLFKFGSLKQAFMFLSFCLIMDSAAALIVYSKETLSYDVLFINQLNQPFLIAVPSINQIYDKYCNWLPVTGTAFPGILINYCYRYDKSFINVETKAFTYLGTFGYFFSSIIYMIITTINPHSMPYSLINYPVMCLFLFLFAYKRSEHLTLWKGSFHDHIESGANFVEDDGKESFRQSSTIYQNEQQLYDGLIMRDMTPEEESENEHEQENKSRQISINNAS